MNTNKPITKEYINQYIKDENIKHIQFMKMFPKVEYMINIKKSIINIERNYDDDPYVF